MRARYNGTIRGVAAATSIVLPFLFFGPATSWVTNGLFPNGSGEFVATYATCEQQPQAIAPGGATDGSYNNGSFDGPTVQKGKPPSVDSSLYAVASDLFYFNIAITLQLLLSCIAAIVSLCIVYRYATAKLAIGRSQAAYSIAAIAIGAILCGAVLSYDETFNVAFPSLSGFFGIVESIANFLGTSDNSDNFTAILAAKIFECANKKLLAPGIDRELLRLIDWGNFWNNSGAALIFICAGFITATTRRITQTADGCRLVIGNLERLVMLAAALLVSGMIALRGYLFLVADLAAGIGHNAFHPLSVAVVNNWGMVWSATLLMAFLPAYLIWRSDVEVLAEFETKDAVYEQQIVWRRSNGLDIAYRDSIKTLLLIMGPALSGPILDIFRAVTSN
jgi:hypothetical protein